MNVDVARTVLPVLFLASMVAVCSCSYVSTRSVSGQASPKASQAAVQGASQGGVPATAAWGDLAGRPVNLTRLAPGQTCPQSTLRQTDPERFGMGLGDGPVYAVAGQKVKSTPTTGNKVLWVADPAYGGPIRIRGGQLDGDGDLLLGGPLHNYWLGQPVKHVSGFDLYRELDLIESGTPTGAPWRAWPSETYIATPGCYAWQVDGLGFTEIITIQA